jgi:hypothetical protein
MNFPAIEGPEVDPLTERVQYLRGLGGGSTSTGIDSRLAS